MKHIKKKFLLWSTKDKLDLSQYPFESARINLPPPERIKFLNTRKGELVFMESEDGFIFGGFVHKIDKRTVLLPVPDPTLVYFNNAQRALRNIKEERDKLLNKVDVGKEFTENALIEIYNFYGETSGFVIFLFTAIEAFINQIIPKDFVYKVESSRKTEIYNKQQIQESIDFNTKLKKVLKQATNKDFFLKQTALNQHIDNLKKFRDDIVHTKPENDVLQYDRLIKEALNFKYDATLEAVATFMNFYKPNYITPCDCKHDF